MKRLITGIIAAALLTGCLMTDAALSEEKISIVTTIFPIYDWTREIVGDAGSVEITLLLDSGVDLHSFQPTAADIMKVTACDLFIYVGGESDEWAEDALKEAVNPDTRVIGLLEALGDGAKAEETVEGMAPEDEDEDEIAYDEHVWLSLRNARVLVQAIADTLGELDPESAAGYAANAAAYGARLDALDRAYAEAVDAASVKTILFGDRFPFRYLADDYGLDYYAAFAGCSAETEASFATIAFLAGKADALALPAVLTIEGADHRIAQTIAQNTQAGNLPVLTMDSMQGVTAADAAKGANYIGIMEENLEVLKLALGE